MTRIAVALLSAFFSGVAKVAPIDKLREVTGRWADR